jgi:hypothetical protein
VSWVFGVVAVTLGIFLLWGLLAPRSQWRVLSSWSVADPHRDEPGGAAYGMRRLFSGLGVLGLGVVVFVASTSYFESLPGPPAPPTQLEAMWGSPTPRIVDRIFTPVGAGPTDLVEMPVLGYQEFDEEAGPPTYVGGLQPFTLLGVLDPPGYIGTIPAVGFAAIDSADLLVHVRGPLLCLPRAAVVTESETTVQIAIYYGLPDPADGSVPDNAAGCGTDDPVTSSVLIPIRLGSPLGDREVQSLDGAPIERVPPPE